MHWISWAPVIEGRKEENFEGLVRNIRLTDFFEIQAIFDKSINETAIICGHTLTVAKLEAIFEVLCFTPKDETFTQTITICDTEGVRE